MSEPAGARRRRSGRALGRLPVAVAAFLVASAAHAERGSDGTLKVIFWQAVSIMTPYLSSGVKDIDAASLVLEPLARYGQDGILVPYLAAEIPTRENGGIRDDLASITWTLKDGLLWSDGTPVTAEDAVFTWRYCTDPAGGCAQAANFVDVESVQALDDRTIRIAFTGPKPYPYAAFVGAESPLLQKAQFADCLGARAPTCTAANTRPIGTGPFRVTDFRANDAVTFEANPHYRDPDKPAFATVLLKGGGDPTSATRAVLETGEFDYAWNPLVEPDVLARMEARGKGEVLLAFGTLVERLLLNQTDPNPRLGGERSTTAHPHPFLTDPRVARALSLAIDRETLVEAGFGIAGRPICNLVPAPPAVASPNNDACLTQDMAEAKRLLDEAGWVPGRSGIRQKDGRKLAVLFQTSTDSVRQATQALIKRWWHELGVEVELRSIDGSVFFGGDPGSPDTLQKFYADIEMYAKSFVGTDPETYLGEWVCNQIPGPATQWQGANAARFCNADYDALVARLSQTADPAARSEIAIKLNDMIVGSSSFIPLVHRGRMAARSNRLGGVVMNPWDTQLWNAADWNRLP